MHIDGNASGLCERNDVPSNHKTSLTGNKKIFNAQEWILDTIILFQKILIHSKYE